MTKKKSPNPRNWNSISVIKSKLLSVSSMNTLLAILKVTVARRDIILAGGLYRRFQTKNSSNKKCTKCVCYFCVKVKEERITAT